MKKSQITIFIITGLIIVTITGFLFLNQYKNKSVKIIDEDSLLSLENRADQITSYVEQCLYEITVLALFNRLGLQGGYIDPDTENIQWQRSGFIKIPYWYYEGEDFSPTLENVENGLSNYLLEKAKNCTNFEGFISLQGIEIIKSDNPKIKVVINDNDVSVEYFYPIIMKIDDNQKTVDMFFTKVIVPIGADFKLAKDILIRMKQADVDGYNLESDCNELNRYGYVNIFPFNQRVVIHDYETFLKPEFQRAFTFQFMHDLFIYGYCPG